MRHAGLPFLFLFCLAANAQVPNASTSIPNIPSGGVVANNTLSFLTKWNGKQGTSQASNFVRAFKVMDGANTLYKNESLSIADLSGSQQWTNQTPLSEGKHTLSTTFQTTGGALGVWYGPTGGDVDFYVDTTKPNINLYFNGAVPSISATDNIGIQKIEMYADTGTGMRLIATPFSTSLPGSTIKSMAAPLPDTPKNPFVVQAKVTDLANWESWSQMLTIQVYSINATASQGGSISPPGTVMVAQGRNQTFNISQDFGYMLDSLTVDGVRVNNASSYTFQNITTNHTIAATFVKSFAIRATADPGGTISPSGIINLGYGQSQTFTAIPGPGYFPDGFTVDGAILQGQTYTFKNTTGTTGTHLINAEFYKPTRKVADINKTYYGDINGDGKQDMICVQNGGIVYTSLSDGLGFPPWNWNSGGRMVNDNARIWLADINGDGRDEFIAIQNGGIVYVSLGNGTGFLSWDWNSGGRMVNDNARIWMADINGDQKKDMVCIQNGGIVYTGLSNGIGFNSWTWNSGGRKVNDNARIWLADINGDKKDDMICIQNGGIAYTSLSDGSGLPTWNWNSGGRQVNDNAQIWMADINGDHMADMVCTQNGGIAYTALSNGVGLNGWSWTSGNRMVADNAIITMSDVNGDGKNDMVCIQNGGIAYVGLSTGIGFPRWDWNSGARQMNDYVPFWMVDVNGDKKSDLVCIQNGGIVYVGLSNGIGTPGWSWASH